MSDGAYFVVPELPAPGAFVLGGDEGRHAQTVLRLRPGDNLVLTDGRGGRAAATVTGSTRGAVTVEVGDGVTDVRPPLTVTLVQALPKGERSELAVDQATQAGVDHIVPWQSARCVARWDGAADKAARGREKWRRAAWAAAKQSRRSRIPTIAPLADTVEVCRRIRASDLAIVLHQTGKRSLPRLTFPAVGEVVLVVGPEGGLTDDEVTMMTEAGGTVSRLGPEVLRTSAAAVVALGVIGALTSRWE